MHVIRQINQDNCMKTLLSFFKLCSSAMLALIEGLASLVQASSQGLRQGLL